MNSYIVILKQAGEGCDYTIGCGRTFKMINAPDDDNAKEQAKEILEYHGSLYPDGERALEEFALFKIDSMIADTTWYNELYEEALQAESDEKQKVQDAKDKKEYERLQHKFKAK